MVESGIVLCLALGAWSALDGSAVGQFLLSRPIVAGTLGGLALGDPGAGFLVGVLLEGAYLGGIPAGGARLPEPGPAAIVGAFAYVSLGGPGGLAIALAVGVGMAAVGGLSVVGQRLANGVITRGVADGPPLRSDLARAQWLCIGLDAGRGLALTGLGMLLVAMIPSAVGMRWPLGLAATVGLFAVPAAVNVGGLLREWIRNRERGLLLFSGCVVGVVVALVV